jgi:hypothetical protein
MNFTYQDPENRSYMDDAYGTRLPGKFKYSSLGRLEARFYGFTMYGEYVRETGMYYATANLRPAPKKDEINAGIGWSTGEWFFQIEGKNIADDQYEDFNGYPLPGRSFYACVKYMFSFTPHSQKE